MDNLSERFRDAKILVVGDVMLDEYVIGAVSRISPEAPVPVLDVRSRYSSAGGAANVAMNVASLGATVFLAGITGNDSAGISLRQLLRSRSIPDKYLVKDSERGTISKTRIIAGQQQICRIDHEERADISHTLLVKLLDAIAAPLSFCHIVVLSDYAKGTLTEECCHQIIQRARIASKQVIVDPKSKDFRKYLGCHVITPNQHEAATAADIAIDSDESLQRAGAKLMAQFSEAASVLITRGSEGMALFQPGEPEPVTIPTEARKVFDVVGAGDTVVATLAVALAAGVPLAEAVALANLAAGIVVEKPGTATLTFDELAARHLSRS
jgi:D-beta-D-heptose 7-phosphate kinase/D-beta-D-heptose 1-phosphate adenosyltransferase